MEDASRVYLNEILIIYLYFINKKYERSDENSLFRGNTPRKLQAKKAA